MSSRLATALCAAAVVGACGTASAASSFSLATTKKCLRQQHVAFTTVPRSDAQKKAFRDLAQRTSIEAVVGSTRVDLAFTPSADHAKLLLELLSPARPPYVIGTRSNVVVMQRKPARAAAVTQILRCLR